MDKLLEVEDLQTFATLAQDIAVKGYSVQENVLPLVLGDLICAALQSEAVASSFKRAGVGRLADFHVNELVRTDVISWIDGETEAGAAWLAWIAAMQGFLNEQLYLGLRSFESHYAHYGKGDFYLTHRDAFKGEDNRRLSIVVYFNRDWTADDAGELILYTGTAGMDVRVSVPPKLGTLVAFLSEDIPHEVLATNSSRYSIAGWFRVNLPLLR